MSKLHDVMEERLNNASYICLIPDIWEHDLTNYLGLAATLSSESCSQNSQIVVLGIRKIRGSTAEEIKATIEDIINGYIFEYRKIKGIFDTVFFNLMLKLKNFFIFS